MPDVPINTLLFGDNLPMLRRYVPDECVDLHYLDPPFNSSRNFFVLFKDRGGLASEAQEAAFTDTWSWGAESEAWYWELQYECPRQELSETIVAMRRVLKETPMMAYLVAMTIRLVELHRTLKPTGSLYLHCDPTASHYLKVLLDTLFGPTNFRNEITWKRTSAHSDAKHKWADVSDVILFYVKSKAAAFTPQYQAHNTTYVEEFYRHDDGDGRGRYRKDNMTSPNPRPNLMYPWHDFPHPAKGWRYSQETMQRLDADGRIYYPMQKDGTPDLTKRPALKRYLQEQEGTIIPNVWTDIPPVQSRGESLGYPTQKPLALLERIISASTKPGDIVCDSFCGCGTAVAAAQKLGRRWIGIDITTVAVGIIKTRMEQAYPELAGKIPVIGFPEDLEGARTLFEQDPYSFQEWAATLIGAYPLRKNGLIKKGADSGIDGWLRFYNFNDEPCRAVVQVKGGKVQVGQIRDFCHVVAREKAELGFFLCMGDEGRTVTRPMEIEALKEGQWQSAGGHCYPKVQILSVKDLLAGTKAPLLPQQDKTSLLGFKARKQTKASGQMSAGDLLFTD